MASVFDLSNRLILVIGASSGIGRQVAVTLSNMGAKVVIVARRKDLLDNVLSELSSPGGSRYCADISKLDCIGELIEKVVADCGRLDGLVYAAGVGTSLPLKLLTPDKVKAIFDINCLGFIETVRQATMRKRHNPGMRIVGISSIAAFAGTKTHVAYGASKAAMEGAVKSLAIELADKQICINTVVPAMTNTRMYSDYVDYFGLESEGHRQLLERQYLGIGEPQDVANAVAFLCSPAARFITGTALNVDGGTLSS